MSPLVVLWARVPQVRRLMGRFGRLRTTDFDGMTPAEMAWFIEASGWGARIRESDAELEQWRKNHPRRAKPGLRATQGGPEEPRGAPLA